MAITSPLQDVAINIFWISTYSRKKQTIEPKSISCNSALNYMINGLISKKRNGQFHVLWLLCPSQYEPDSIQYGSH